MDQIQAAWLQSGFPVPKVLLAYYDGKPYATTSDNTTIGFFASNGCKIYAVPMNKTRIVQNAQGVNIYVIDEIGSFQVVSCESPFTPWDEFAVDRIVPILFGKSCEKKGKR